MALDIFKLEKLKIDSFKDAARSRKAPESFEAMFNPTSVSWTNEVAWSKAQATNAAFEEKSYSHTPARTLSFDLVLDGTGADEFLALRLSRQSVLDMVKTFETVAYTYDGEIHEPRYLRVSWGAQPAFDCRLSSYSLKYTLFDRDGSPLRAELSISLEEDIPDDKAAKIEAKSSPDLSHARVVVSGDTLPLLTRSIYGSSERYLDVARYNGLDDFRILKPGTQLLFPPLAVFDKDRG